MRSNIYFILNQTLHPGNIGSAARALKTMGLSNLMLVNPKRFPHEDAKALAAGADDVLENAPIYSTLQEAIADKHLIIGTSARDRSLAWPMLDPKQAAEKICEAAKTTKVAILFGREDFGLNNDELQLCHFHLQIPANPEYSSLNIAASVQVIAYEIHMALLTLENMSNVATNDNDYATAEQTELFYQHLDSVLHAIAFIRPGHPNRIMQRLRRVFQRSQLQKEELDILRGILKEVEKKTKI